MGHSDSTHRLFGLDMRSDPYSQYEFLRAQDPVQWVDETKAWVITGHKEVNQIMKNRQCSADRVSLVRGRYDERFQPVFDVLARVMVQVDDPKHKHLRELVHNAFTRTVVHEYEPRILALCDDLLSPGLKRGEIEFMSEFAVPLPILVISEIVGVPTEDRAQIREWCDAYSFLILNFFVHLTEEELSKYMPMVEAFCDYLRDKIEEAERSPRHDLISSLAHAAQNDNNLTVDDVIANCMILLNAGNETTSCILGTGMRLLSENADQLALLRSNPDLIPNAVEEFLRLEGPVQFLGRVANADIEVGGKTIAKGDLILPVIAAANRDPKVFDDPNRLDITRSVKHHMGFGSGTHLCAGIQLARFEATVTFRYLLNTLQSFESKTDAYDYSANFNLRGLSSLPLRIRGNGDQTRTGRV